MKKPNKRTGRRKRGPVDGLRASGWAMFAVALCCYDRGKQRIEDSERGVLFYSLEEHLRTLEDPEQRRFTANDEDVSEWWNSSVCADSPNAPQTESIQWSRWITGERNPLESYRRQLIRYLASQGFVSLAKGLQEYWAVGPLGMPLWVTLGADMRSIEREWGKLLGQPLGPLGVHVLDTWAAMGEPLPALKRLGTYSETYGLETIIALQERWNGLDRREQALRFCAWLAARRVERASLPVLRWKDVPKDLGVWEFSGWGVDPRDIPAYLSIMDWIQQVQDEKQSFEKIKSAAYMVERIQRDRQRFPLPPVYFK